MASGLVKARSRCRRAGLACLLIAAIAASAAAPAPAQTIGTNLDRAPSMPFGCEAIPSTDFRGLRFYLPTGATTCTYVGTGTLGAGETAGAIGPGVLTRVRVRAGAPTGPVQATIVRAYRSVLGFACCFYATASKPFTPAANAVTAVNVRLPMRSDLDPEFGETVDYLALTVLGPGYPVPAYDGGVPGDLSRPGALGFFPLIKPGDERVDGAGVGDFAPLIQGDFRSLCGAAALRPRFERDYRRASCSPALAIAGAVARAQAGRAVMRLLCNDPIGCAGRLSLVGSAGKRAKRGGGATYAKGAFKLAPGDKGKLKAKLTRAGRRLLARRRAAKVTAKVKLTTGSVKRLSSKVKLRR